MKRIHKAFLSVLFALFFVTPSFGGTTNVGFAVDLTSIDASGTETLNGNSTSSSKSHSHSVAIPSLFIEREGDSGVRIGLDYIPIDGAMGEESRSDDDYGASGSTSVTRKAKADLQNHVTVYLEVPLGSSNFYGRIGVASVTIATDENLDSTGSTYPDEDVMGFNLGIGTEREFGNNGFFKAALNYVNYEDVELTSSSSNKITADVDRLGFQLSVGKKF